MKNLQTIQADSMAAALAEVKRRLGDDAVILHTRTVTRRGMLGVRNRKVVEITAAAHISSLPHRLAAVKVIGRCGTDAAANDQSPGMAGSMVAPSTLGSPSSPPDRAPSTLPGNRRSAAAQPEHVRRAHVSLLQNEVAADVAANLVKRLRSELAPEQLNDPALVRARLADQVAELLPATGGIQPRPDGRQAVVVLVGPAGVGKTTTAAKLAAQFTLQDGRRVGLVTTDTCRVAAVEQLRTYAEIIDVPLAVADSPGELRAAVASLSECDLVLVDTAGCGPRDAGRISDLQQFIQAVPGCEVHLVLSAASSSSAACAALASFASLDADHVIFSKLDEAVGYGVMLNCLQKAKLELSYVTTGQNVPADIEIVAPRRLAEAIVGTVGN